MSFALPTAAGIGLCLPHVREVLERRPPSPGSRSSENYFADGGPAVTTIERIRADYPIAMMASACGSASPTRSIASICAGLRAWPSVSRCLVGTLVLERRGRTPLQRSPAAAVQRGCARSRLRACGRGEDDSSASSWSRTCRATTRSPMRPCPNASSWPRSPRAPAACCWSMSTTSTSTRATTASTRSPPRSPAAGRGRGDSSGGLRCQRTHRHRHSRRGRRAGSVVAVRGRDRALRAGAHARRVDTDIPDLAVLEREAATAQRVLSTHATVAA